MPTPHPQYNPNNLDITNLTSVYQFTSVVMDILESAVATLRQRTYRTRYGMRMVQEAEQFLEAWRRVHNLPTDFTDDDLEL